MTAPGRLTLLLASPRVPAGILTRDAWAALESAAAVRCADLDDPTPAALAAGELEVQETPAATPAALAAELVALAAQGAVVWLGSPDADPGLTDALAVELTRSAQPPEVEVLVGSFDAPGARLLDAVAVMDRLRSPGGCPWDAEQTHDSLAPYLVEEAHETLEAIGSGDREHLLEELGDVLLQVLFHARLAAEDEQDPFDVDDVAATLVAKLVRRHPHVFADGDARTPEQVEAAWERIKAQEKPAREAGDLLAGVPDSLPVPLAAQKARARLRRAGGDEALDAALARLAAAALSEHERGWALLREAAGRGQ